VVLYAVLIPAFNAGKTLYKLLTELKSLPAAPLEIFVVDDGSTDNTRQIALEMGVYIYRFPENKGKGEALKKGFELFMKQSQAECLVCMDADLQHEPRYIQTFLKKKETSGSSVIIGKRDFSLKTMPFLRYLSNRITSFVISKLSGRKVYDSQSGFRLIPKEVLSKITLKESGFQLESEFILRCAEANINIDHIDIPAIYNNNGSNIKNIKDTLKFIRFIMHELFKK
jgi:glycosyltransferase involved in cell wall biosynthesis